MSDQYSIIIHDPSVSGHASAPPASPPPSASSPSSSHAASSSSSSSSDQLLSSLDERMNMMESNISMIVQYIRTQEAAKANSPFSPPPATVDQKPAVHGHGSSPLVKDESSSSSSSSSTPFHRGVTFQSDVGVNRDHTPHPVVAKIMSGYTARPSSSGSGSGNYGNGNGHGGGTSSSGVAPHPTLPMPSLMKSPPLTYPAPAGIDDDDDDVRSVGGSTSSRSSTSYEDKILLSMKLDMPSKYKGSMSHDSANLRIWIAQMNNWFDAKKLSHESKGALVLAVTRLDGYASSWYENVRTEVSINSWSDLRALMIQRFEREDIEELSAFALMDTKYRTDVTSYTHQFNQHVQLAPKHLRHDQPMLILMYLHGLRDYRTALLRVSLKNNMAMQGMNTLTQVQNEALRLDDQIRSAQQGANSSPAATNTFVSGRPAVSSRFGRGTPPRRPAFSTPQKLHHVAAASTGGDSIVDMNSLVNHGGIDEYGDDDDSFRDEPTQPPAFHDEDEYGSSSSPSGNVDEVVESAMLHAMKTFVKYGERMKVSPEEIMRCRKLNLCFKCKRPGHMASACVSTTNGHQSKNE